MCRVSDSHRMGEWGKKNGTNVDRTCKKAHISILIAFEGTVSALFPGRSQQRVVVVVGGIKKQVEQRMASHGCSPEQCCCKEIQGNQNTPVGEKKNHSSKLPLPTMKVINTNESPPGGRIIGKFLFRFFYKET